MARLRKLHSLKRPKIRPDWSKYTLYNLSRLRPIPTAPKTYFQQKWLAKSATRAYHSPYVREKTWTRMFDRRLPAVVPMDHQYLAKFDGSELSSGRGSGREEKVTNPEQRKREMKTPYMHMTFGPLERRLDTAIWRALFASSARQARQFVVHGAVKVNGKKMIHPSYQLNPGDMFSVEPERVLYATGARKLRKSSPVSPQHERDAALEAEEAERTAQMARNEKEKMEKSEVDVWENVELEKANLNLPKNSRNALKTLLSRAKRITTESKQKMSGKRQQELREFARLVKKTLGQIPTKGEASVFTAEQALKNLEQSLTDILVKVPTEQLPRDEAERADEAAGRVDPNKAKKEVQVLQEALERVRIGQAEDEENPVDSSKPYATPWRPRDYMSAFAFIPRYLEVNQNICSAVYLRHPVARPGVAEVPSPFDGETQQLAFNWYLRRR